MIYARLFFACSGIFLLTCGVYVNFSSELYGWVVYDIFYGAVAIVVAVII